MKEAYRSPEIDIIDLAAMERITAMEEQFDGELRIALDTAGDIYNPSFGIVPRNDQ